MYRCFSKARKKDMLEMYIKGGFMNIVRLSSGYIVAVAVVSIALTGVQAQAAEKEATPKTEQKSDQKSAATYRYTAQPGDTYTQLVRKAVQTYGINEKKDIGKARIIAIETRAASEAQWPVLSIGQKVSFTQAEVKSWVDNAMKLSEADVAAWRTYVPYIDFDTRSIGE